MSHSISSSVQEDASPQTGSWFGVDLPTWSLRIQSAFADAKEAALRENEELRIRPTLTQQVEELQQRVANLEHVLSSVIDGRVSTAQSSAH